MQDVRVRVPIGDVRDRETRAGNRRAGEVDVVVNHVVIKVA